MYVCMYVLKMSMMMMTTTLIVLLSPYVAAEVFHLHCLTAACKVLLRFYSVLLSLTGFLCLKNGLESASKYSLL